MELLTSLIGAPVNAITLLVTAGILFMMMVEKGLIKIGKGTTDHSSVTGEVKRLSTYYNHDLTQKLDKLLEMEEKEHEAADGFRDLMKDVHAMLKEFKEYGIRLRKD